MDKNNLCMYSLAGHVGMYCIVLYCIYCRGEKKKAIEMMSNHATKQTKHVGDRTIQTEHSGKNLVVPETVLSIE